MTRFEYTVCHVKDYTKSNVVLTTLDDYGREGWELVAVIAGTANFFDRGFFYYFKRVVTE